MMGARTATSRQPPLIASGVRAQASSMPDNKVVNSSGGSQSTRRLSDWHGRFEPNVIIGSQNSAQSIENNSEEIQLRLSPRNRFLVSGIRQQLPKTLIIPVSIYRSSDHSWVPTRSAIFGSVSGPPLGRASIRRGENIWCGVCGRAPPQLYACVSCAAVACRAHAPPHAEETLHHVAVDVDRAELFCCSCRDQVYDRDFDAAVVEVAVGIGPLPPPENLRKRRRVDYKPWTPDLKEQALIAENSSPLPPSQLGGDSVNRLGVYPGPLPCGLRGLSNLGNTCFMNSVLQALLHTPPLRNYFLSDKHNRFYCERENRTIVTRKTEINKANNKNVQLCLACDLDAIFSAVFSGDRMPYSPAKFLYSWWQHASNLASYEQQDAHEFFISMLDGIHEKMQKDRRKPHIQGSGDCCIAHRVFSGILRSDVMCTSCGFTSTTYDPCVDISLDLEPNQLVLQNRHPRNPILLSIMRQIRGTLGRTPAFPPWSDVLIISQDQRDWVLTKNSSASNVK
ncbi:UNVERIFIED_CONTAM: Ubiquitin C-terminal hydrolase 22 [Sesamum radiatum]|uniref:ubiquitinyl hydrolase 1 n=1 Tax=Sesamum radiatum TaxID=300843 RepID=A0AAW2NR58_SESRA